MSEAARGLGVCRELASRLHARFWGALVSLIQRMNTPGPRQADPVTDAQEERLHVLEALLGVARAIIAAANLTAFVPARRREIVVAVEKLHAEHSVAYRKVASALGLCDRTLRRWRREHESGGSLVAKSHAPLRPYGKLPDKIAAAILCMTSLHDDLSLAELWRRFVREQKRLCEEHGHPDLSYGAFRRNAGREPAKDKKPRTKPRRGRDAPLNIPPGTFALMDTTDICCFGFPFKLISFMEAHTREIFAHQLVERERAETIEKVLGEGLERGGGTLGLRVDRGTPYLADVVVSSAFDHGVDMRVARAYTPTDKAILERFHGTAKDAVRDALECLDLSEGPGTLAWRRDLACTIAARVLGGYLRWGYPYIPQPHIDGRTPRERTLDAPPASAEVIRAALDRNVRHHEHARTLAREIHGVYGFRWSMHRWLGSVRGFRAEDLREAQRRFDRVLLKGCFTCDSRRNPRYLLTVVRDVARQRKQRKEQDRERERQRRQRDNAWRIEREPQERAFRQELQRKEDAPEQAAEIAIRLAITAVDNRGFGLQHAEHTLRHALAIIARNGREAYRLATDRLLDSFNDERIRRWIRDCVTALLPASRPLATDLRV